MFCDVFTPGNMIMCYDLMCVWKLSRDSLAKHTVPKLNTDMPEKTKKNSWSPWSQSHVWKGTRTIWSEREKEWWMVTVVMKEMTNWCEWDQMRVIGLHDQQAGEVPLECDSRDRVMRDGKSGCWLLKRKMKVNERYNIWVASAAMGLNRDKII